MKRKLIAGNWKMNPGYKDSENLAREIEEKLDKKLLEKIEVLICPTFVSLGIVNKVIRNSGIKLGAQNVYFENDGAYTGEISASILKSVGCEYVIIGHSERRMYLHETNKIINKKIKKALEFELKPIVCVGETFQEREDEIYEGVVEKQVNEAFLEIPEQQMRHVIIAYEPVWAIGTGLNATPQQASDMHSFVRKVIEKLYSRKISENILLLYGGSVNETNSKEMLSAYGIDGALIGGASLKADEFTAIVKIASNIK